MLIFSHSVLSRTCFLFRCFTLSGDAYIVIHKRSLVQGPQQMPNPAGMFPITTSLPSFA